MFYKQMYNMFKCIIEFLKLFLVSFFLAPIQWFRIICEEGCAIFPSTS